MDAGGGGDGRELAFVPDGIADDVIAGRFRPEPLVLHAAAGECLTVHFTNRRKAGPEGPAPRASFHVAKLDRTPESAGVNVGYDPEGTVAPGESRTYRYHVQSDSIGSAAIGDFGGNDTGSRGLYGAVVVAPAGAEFADAKTGLPRDVGAQVDVRLPGGRSYRDFTLLFADDDAVIGGNTMPYPSAVSGPALVNYRSAPRADDASMFSSRAHGDPATPILTAYPAIRCDPRGGRARLGAGARLLARRARLAAGRAPPEERHRDRAGLRGLGDDRGLAARRRRRLVAQHRRHVLGRPAASVHRGRHVGSHADRLRREVPDQAASRTRLHRRGADGVVPGGTGRAGHGAHDGDDPRRHAACPDAQAAKPRPGAAPRSADTTLRDLVLPSRSTRAQLRRGVRLSVTAPAATRMLRVELRRAGSRSAPVVTELALPRGGAVTTTWRLPARTIARLRTGTYVVTVGAGTAGPRLTARMGVR